MPKRMITDEELREAAREVLEYELAIFDSYNDYPDHIFHGKFRLNMAALIHEVKRGAVKAVTYSMGFTFYVKRCIAAVLLLFTMSCIAMPETVLAGYHKLIEVIETVFEDYTEYRYRVNDDGGIEEIFKPLKLGYLPEGMEEVKRIQNINSINLVYTNKNKQYIDIYQKRMQEYTGSVYTIDNTKQLIEEVILKGEKLLLIYEEERLFYVWVQAGYRVTGFSNMEKDRLIEILDNMIF